MARRATARTSEFPTGAPKARPRPRPKPRPKKKAVKRHLQVVPEAPRTSRAKENRHLIILLVSTTAVLVGIGFVMVLSASSVAAFTQYGSSFIFAWRQLLYIGIGFVALFVAARMPYRAWRTFGPPLLAISVGVLILVLIPGVGTVAGGSARWIGVGPINIQPSEFAKFAMIACVATILARRWNDLRDPRNLVVIVPLVGVVAALIMLQPDLGTTLVIAVSVFMMVFISGVSMRYIFGTAAVGIAALTILIFSSSYRRARFLSFWNPWKDPQNTGYHSIQSMIALGSGGWTGVGLGASRQKWLYVPNAHTDFIFAIIGEELGLIGAFCVIALLGTLVYAAVRIAARAPDVFGRLLAGGIAVWFGVQVMLNLGAVTGVLPITGVPLPLVSYGGSALIVTMAAVGILVNIALAGRAAGPGQAALKPVSARRRVR